MILGFDKCLAGFVSANDVKNFTANGETFVPVYKQRGSSFASNVLFQVSHDMTRWFVVDPLNFSVGYNGIPTDTFMFSDDCRHASVRANVLSHICFTDRQEHSWLNSDTSSCVPTRFISGIKQVTKYAYTMDCTERQFNHPKVWTITKTEDGETVNEFNKKVVDAAFCLFHSKEIGAGFSDQSVIDGITNAYNGDPADAYDVKFSAAYGNFISKLHVNLPGVGMLIPFHLSKNTGHPLDLFISHNCVNRLDVTSKFQITSALNAEKLRQFPHKSFVGVNFHQIFDLCFAKAVAFSTEIINSETGTVPIDELEHRLEASCAMPSFNIIAQAARPAFENNVKVRPTLFNKVMEGGRIALELTADGIRWGRDTLCGYTPHLPSESPETVTNVLKKYVSNFPQMMNNMYFTSLIRNSLQGKVLTDITYEGLPSPLWAENHPFSPYPNEVVAMEWDKLNSQAHFSEFERFKYVTLSGLSPIVFRNIGQSVADATMYYEKHKHRLVYKNKIL